jgi:hypothetical protein
MQEYSVRYHRPGKLICYLKIYKLLNRTELRNAMLRKTYKHHVIPVNTKEFVIKKNSRATLDTIQSGIHIEGKLNDV